ncbi:MAG TPA: hypothetical protein VHB21_26190, partial [Minicystis sp.]|nr:hypothetical protein [Minicystis sp.]
AAAEKPFDPCADSKPVPHPYHGILRSARCEQEMFLTMASVADQLGVECTYCHVPLIQNGVPVPKKEDYPVMTDRKLVANWMSTELMRSIKPAAGGEMKCKLCHVDEHGKPVAKIFGYPRSREKAMEWMNLVMVNKFVTLSGDKLKCKYCHEANVGSPGFDAKVILTDHLPPHPPLEKAPPPLGAGAPLHR